jgi:hypothetical protein
VTATWDEQEGWCVELSEGLARSSRSYLHPDLLPTARTVAEFVVGLALGRCRGATDPIGRAAPARPRLRLVR